MEGNFLIPQGQMMVAKTMSELAACNEVTGLYGITLSQAQMMAISSNHARALEATGRVEFGTEDSAMKKLVLAFCDSPYLTQQNSEELLSDLIELFYDFKNETGDSLTDEELLEVMKSVFDGKAQGSLEYLEGMNARSLWKALKGFDDDDDNDDEESEL